MRRDVVRTHLLLAAVLLVAACAPGDAPVVPPPNASPGDVRQTEVRSYDPWGAGLVTETIDRRGACEKPSRVVQRSDAWQCQVRDDHPASDGSLHEPCFAHPTEPRAACPEGVDERSFTVVTLAEPLPRRSPPVAEVAPWMVVLWTGDRCVRVADVPIEFPRREGRPLTMMCSPLNPRIPSPAGDRGWGGVDTSTTPWTLRVSDGTGPEKPAMVMVAYR
ncbi:hypothetical protein ABZ816_20155 [Actinosynnema sp. NPDC047251]|uniref:Putative secreted protein n=1 Tax=Saccharothrix espanaensis (strain ATCC 51144 / DSM 44229 / JCM 9112 / NBRC 15066 / NRRL 15764) TaxID=1179773 RepID=K0KEA5_SACES|nr:hypothetical protein [Saccharothrix espanaensis]CCH34878.1 putative secreted protein [Saccharothrix espanaensis DSM 44229]